MHASIERARTAYYALVYRLDVLVGQVLQCLADEGLADDTLVVYTTDHGDQLGERGLWWKHTLYEDSVRVPLVLRWPRQLPAGERRAQVVDLLDVSATMAAALGGTTLPYGRGRNLLPVARDPRASWVDEVFSEHCTDSVPAWTGGQSHQQRMIRSGSWKLIYSHGHPVQLFDLTHDPRERHDLAADPQHAAIRDRLQERVLEDWDPHRVAARIAARRREKNHPRRVGAQCAARRRVSLDAAARAEPPRRGGELMRTSARWPRLGLGCATLGTPAPELTDADAEGVIAAAIAQGIRLFDVAPLYGGGLAEVRLGRALEHAGLARGDFVLCTKTGVTRPYGQGALGPGATRRRQYDRWDYGAAATRVSIQTSLERLRTDRIDIVHLHDAENHLDRCLEAHAELVRLRDEGVIDGIGIGSNLAAPVAQLIDRAPFDAFLLAGCYTLLDTSGRSLIEAAQRRGIAVVAGGVYNSGVLAAWPQAAPTFGYQPADTAILELTARIASICARHGVALAAVALQFALAQPAIRTVLIGPRTVAELAADLAAAELPIPDALWGELAAAHLIPADAPRPARAAALH